ncbi:MAG: MBL fold metallo-hydrolase [Deltaproteobacteria bacterium]|nr:MBL fold metallo-hydrolase [Deltaproteobacteria bacterium]
MTIVSRTRRAAAFSIRFLGGAGTVTGSKFLVETGGVRVLVDCGLYQGLKQLRLRNWARLPLEPSSLDAILLTHAHIDHSGQLPLFVKQGFRGHIYATAPTADLCGILLPDSGRIQEEDADFANRAGFSKHKPALPLYTEEEARRVLPMLVEAAPGEPIRIGAVTASFRRAGHILGAASIEIEAARRRVLFSGDLGRSIDPICPPPEPPEQVDALVMESTYGDRVHPAVDVAESLAQVLDRAVAESGVVLIPAFAVGRAQAMLYWLDRIFESGRVARLPVFVDSPMATSVTELYRRHGQWHRLSRADCDRIFGRVRFTRSVDESKRLAAVQGPAVLISASGMLTGGRVLHHFKRLAPEPANTILLAGFQAPGTRGGALAAGAKELKMHGGYVPVRAKVEHIDALSAHADQSELLSWLRSGAAMPGRVVLVHGEAVAADTLRRRIEEDLRLPVSVAESGGRVTVGSRR